MGKLWIFTLLLLVLEEGSFLNYSTIKHFLKPVLTFERRREEFLAQILILNGSGPENTSVMQYGKVMTRVILRKIFQTEINAVKYF